MKEDELAELLESNGWHEDSDGLWNNPKLHKHGRTLENAGAELLAQLMRKTDELAKGKQT